MLGAITDTVLTLITLEIKARLRAMTVTAVLTLIGMVLLMTALGFALALLYVWLQIVLGTIVALAVVAGAAAFLALILFALAAWRPKPGSRKPVQHAPAPPPPPRAEDAGGQSPTDRMIDEAITVMQQGSREQMLATLSLALVTGIVLGRRE